MKHRYIVTAIALIAVLLAGAAFAQTTGSLVVKITDESGAPLPGASVNISSPALQGTKSLTSDNDGNARFSAIPPGAYSIKASLSGFGEIDQKATLGLDQTINIPIKMRISTTAEISVTGEAPTIDISTSTVQTTVSAEQAKNIPFGRNFANVALTAPGATEDRGLGGTTQSNISVYGATSLENQFVVDGINTTGIKVGDQQKRMNQEFIQEIEIKTATYQAEYGRTLGGVINVITKQGGNEFHGDAFGYYDNKSLQSKVKDPLTVNGGSFSAFTEKDFGLDLGGYLIKDTLWFFGAYDRDLLQREAVLDGTGGPFDGDKFTETDRKRNLYSTKLTLRIGDNNTIVGTILGDPATADRQFVLNGPPESRTETQKTGGTDYGFRWDGILSSSNLIQASIAQHKDRESDFPVSDLVPLRWRIPLSDEYTGGVEEPCTTAQPCFRGGIYARLVDEHYKRNQYRLSDTMFIANNEIKAGLDFEILDSVFNEYYPGGQLVTARKRESDGSIQYTHRYFAKDTGPTFGLDAAALGGIVNHPKTSNSAFYLQDSWKPTPVLTVNLGLRYDTMKLKDAVNGNTLMNKHGLAPRLGVVWDVMGNSRSKLFASGGRFYETIPQDIQTRELGNEISKSVRNHDLNSFDCESSCTTQGGGFVPIDPDLKLMYQDEYVLGYEQEVAANFSVGVKGIYKNLGRAIEDRCDINSGTDAGFAFAPGQCIIENPGEGSFGKGIFPDQDVPAGSNPQVECLDADGNSIPCIAHPKAKRKYKGFELTARKTFNEGRGVIFASYLYSQLRGNYDGNLKESNQQGDPNINGDYDYAGLTQNFEGKLFNDRPHQFKVTGSYNWNFGAVDVTAGTNAFWRSGHPTSKLGFFNDFYPIDQFLSKRGSEGRTPSDYDIDLHVGIGMNFGAVRAELVGDVFRVLNRQRVLQTDERWNPDGDLITDPSQGTVGDSCNNAKDPCNEHYGKPTVTQLPRQARIGLRISF